MVSPELALLRECQDRVLEREGIPMVLALVSEVGVVPPAAEPAIVADGRRLAERMDQIGQAVAPTGRDLTGSEPTALADLLATSGSPAR